MPGPANLLTPSATTRRASMSRPESVSSSTAIVGLEHRQLEDLHPLLLASREAVVQVARGELLGDVGEGHRLLGLLAEVLELDRLLAGGLAMRVDAMRRYLATVTPGIATGYWKAMNRPIRERSSGLASVMSSPLKVIVPSVTSRLGWPMIALARVDLPDPFGPIRAWIDALLDVEADALEDLLALGGHVQVADLELCQFVLLVRG